jgi:hypothetical protein
MSSTLNDAGEKVIVLDELDVKKGSYDWLAISTPNIKRAVDINSVHTLHHETDERYNL